MSKVNKILAKLKIINEPNENNLLTNITKTPRKEKPPPTTRATAKNARQQADLLFLPDDDGYKYLLVCVDIATKLCDAEPLKKKTAPIVRDALKKIYLRKILSVPKVDIQVDAGSEFQGEFKTYFDKVTKVFTKLPFRHRQQSVVEAKNKVIGEVLNKSMLAEEINNDVQSKSWVKYVKKVVKLINENYEVKPYIPDVNKPVITNDFTKEILPVGTKVRVILDAPRDYVSGKRLNGGFRKGDLRFSKEIHTITQVYLNPDTPPGYQIDNNTRVSYPKENLLVVQDGEQKPNNTSNKFYAQQVIDKRKIKNKIEYLIRWEEGENTWEERKNIITDLKELIDEYEAKVKKSKK